jgi:hypothetical protein
MTVSTTTAKSGPYAGSGTTGPFTVGFRFLENSHILVVKNVAGVETNLVLDTDYTVTGAGASSGSVTLATALATGQTLTIVRNVPTTQETDYVAGDSFPAESHERALDQLTMIAQQLKEEVDRSAKLPVSSTADADALVADIVRLADSADEIDAVADIEASVVTVAGIDSEVATVAGIAANVTTVAGIAANVTSVAGISSNVTTVAGVASNVTTVAEVSSAVTTVAGISAAVSTVAADGTDIGAVAAISADVQAVADIAADVSAVENIAANVTTVAGIAANVTTVAGISAAVSTVATNAAAVSTVATNITDVQNAEENADAAIAAKDAALVAQAAAESALASTLAAFDSFDDRYLGSKTSDPSVDNDGNALAAGALYFNSSSGIMKVYTGSAWVAAYVSAVGLLAAANNLSDVANAATARDNLGVEIGVDVQAYDANLTSLANKGLFKKVDATIVAWTKTGAGTATSATTIYIDVNGSIKTIASGASITMPTLTAGTDYAIWAKTDGTLEATSNHTSPPTANARKVGGFHYAAGSNATGTSGGNTTAQINEYSFWDLKFKPSCADPRGMTLVGGAYWMDIYLTGVDAITNGSSKYNVTMADGSSPPKVPTMFGGNGSTTYGTYTWFEAMELATAFGKRCPTQREFMSAMYSTTEASSIGSDQGSTVLNAAYTSKWGVIQSTGVLWIWGDDRGGAYATGGWNANTEGRGSEYNAPDAVLLGGHWDNGSNSGSRCSAWSSAASDSGDNIGSRFCCDHLQLD